MNKQNDQPAGWIARRPTGLSTSSISTRPSLAPPLRVGAATVVARFARPMASARQPFSIQHSALPARRAGCFARPMAIARHPFSIQHSAFSIRNRRPHAIIFRPFASLPKSSTMQASPRPPVFPPLSIHRRGAAMGLKLYFFDFEPRIGLTKPSISDRFTHIRPRMRETGTGEHRCFSDAMDNWKN